jgi:protein-S-isoprenylcysteine O-methyltransferase Ste14
MNIYYNSIFLAFFAMFVLQMLGFGIYLKINKISFSGVPPLHPVLFKTAKAAMMLSWLALFIETAGFYNLSFLGKNEGLTAIAVILFAVGSILQLISYINLGKNLKFGIPAKEEQQHTTLKVEGLYRFSRNPMYVGFFLMTIATCLYVLNPIVWVMAIFGIVVHHSIILKEEIFLKERFGNAWDEYSKKVNRYL